MSAPSPDQPTIRFVDVDGVRLRTSVRGTGAAAAADHRARRQPGPGRAVRAELTTRGVQTISFDAPGVGQSTAVPAAATDARRRPHRGAAAGRARLRPGRRARRLARRRHRPAARPPGTTAGPPARARRHRPRVSAACPGRRGCCWRWPPRAATTSPTTTAASPGASTAGRPAATRTRCCTARSPGSSDGPDAARLPRPALRDQPAGPACPGCGGLRQPTLVLAGDDDPIVPLVNGRILARLHPATPGCTSCRAAATCSCSSSRREMAAVVAGFLKLPTKATVGVGPTARPGPRDDTENTRRR